MAVEIWLLITAVVFTLVGVWMGRNSATEDAVEHTIDTLIERGYLRTRGTGKDQEILKWNHRG